jgi:hypothetical protein
MRAHFLVVQLFLYFSQQVLFLIFSLIKINKKGSNLGLAAQTIKQPLTLLLQVLLFHATRSVQVL